ncbi:hypothetical protein YYC_05684 [Plasmodium yoelii 17X]|uniref:Uncharacterized protein n=2 Tax=Plasmodium yoelii TaxID=5861 RepID=A0A078KK10_PLAYE|nr:conserved protein, unknown function [Plasmodium yoelii]ETB56228.1 hypothetical protein YYC_05684 [Plasmodium yoelii 17X]CDU19772.1 conserved Plasmodium protein, unknown function [Plasmodium yoelii]VTZ80529.1 conserved protein, unknown function [Plasmodium yoelii]|eukprot:XP_022813532.1 conserved protein, unknown function [Plasmodium yoelii]
MKQLIIFILIIFIVHINVGLSQMCTTDICEKCCYPTNEGCRNKNYKAMRNNDNDKTYCRLCDCGNSSTGCGWVGEKYGKVKCTSCSFINQVNNKIKYFDIAGCGYQLKKGTLLSNS